MHQSLASLHHFLTGRGKKGGSRVKKKRRTSGGSRTRSFVGKRRETLHAGVEKKIVRGL